MDGAHAAGMSGAPRLEQIERFSPANLTDRDAIGAQPQTGANQVGQRCDAVLRPHRDQIGRGALQFPRILDQDHAIRCLCYFGEESRSEEHTSELQSLMRISYAVFCLKKKNKTK